MQSSGVSSKIGTTIITAVVFLSAFLLFISEPLIGRLLLPFLGGAIYIWLVCLMFFQAMLLLGYLYGHLLAKKIGFWHVLILALPLVNLPFRINTEPNFQTPILSLLVVLLTRFALPFTILSTTVIVVQSWLTRSYFGRDYEPYPLYAASNAGSLIALFGYAFVVEPMVGLKNQSLFWAIGYLVFIVLMFVTWYLLIHDPRNKGAFEKRADVAKVEPPVPFRYVTWLLLSCLPSALLLTVSNFISAEIGSFPLIWIIPLSLYLCSFIVTFRTNGGVPKLVKMIWPEILLLAAAFYFIGTDSVLAILGCLLVFWIICILSHGKLYESRPPVRWLTNFYLTTAVGGFLGGVLVSVIAPFIFKGYSEYLIILFTLGVVFCWLREKSFKEMWHRASFLTVVSRIVFLAVAITPIVIGSSRLFKENIRYRHRNFYGTYRIFDYLVDTKIGAIRMLLHGKTLHGSQLLDPSFQMMPVAYYYPGGGISDVYETTPKPRRMAVIGLGAGVISTYVEKQDSLTFFEIDPDNYGIAKTWFTYLDKCKGKVNVVTGDGRLSIKNSLKDGLKFDIITIDAFTGDAIPIHLLTKEALEVYLSKLADDGIILFHISNRYYNLRPVIKSTSATLHLFGAMNPIGDKKKLMRYQESANCVAIARNSVRLQSLIERGWKRFGNKDGLPGTKPWTDDHINIIKPLMEKTKDAFFNSK